MTITNILPDEPARIDSIDVDRRAASWLRGFAMVANAVVFIIPLLVLIGWTFGIERLKRVVPGFIEMNPFSALHFILLGFALVTVRLSSSSATRGRKAFLAALRIFACLFVVAFGVVMECKYFVGWDAQIDRMLFPKSIGTNRMAPNTAAAFVFLGVALLMMNVETRRRFRPAQALAVLVALIALLALVGYGYQVGKLFGIGRYAPMALHVAFCFLMLSLALLCTQPEAGLMRHVTSCGAGGVMARRLLFWMIAVPLALGWLILRGVREDSFDTAFGFTLFVVAVIIFTSLMIWRNAASLDRKDAEQNAAEDSLRRARDELEIRVKERVGDLAKVMTEVRDAVNLLADASSDIVKSSSALTGGATETAGAVAETLTTVEELRKTAELSSQQAASVAAGAHEAEQTAERGKISASAAEQAMERIRGQMEALAERTIRLGDQTKSIGEIITTVDDIAQQTNVLAINAAIEAAKAKEHGRGFAVVANEIRALAAQSQAATTQVRNILKEIYKANHDAINATKESRAGVEAGVREFERAGESITALTGQITNSAQAAVQISASVEQQSTGVDQVSDAMRRLNAASERNAATARRLETAAQNLNALGQRLRDLVGRYQA